LTQQTFSPIDGTLLTERTVASESVISEALARAKSAQRAWRGTSIRERIAICRHAMKQMLGRKQELGVEITCQMGRPIRYTPNEIVTMADRAFYMCDIAESTLAPIELPDKEGFVRYIRREPLGVAFAIVPWNYPFLTAINSVVPPVVGGNTVLV